MLIQVFTFPPPLKIWNGKYDDNDDNDDEDGDNDDEVGDNDDDEADPNVYIPAAPQDLEWEEAAT